MAVELFGTTRILVQGITGREGRLHAKLCAEYGARIVAGVTPGRGGESVDGVPVFDTVADAVAHRAPDMSLVFVPPNAAADAMLEAVFAGVRHIVCITEGVPVHDMIRVKRVATTYGATIIGPNCPGIITPGHAKAGIMPGQTFLPGHVGMVSRSGTLLYEAASQVCSHGLGISTAIGIGGDPIIGTDFIRWLKAFADDPETEAVVLIGEIGGAMEERTADFIRETAYSKPLVAFIAGQTAPEGRRMGHAGAIIMGRSGSACSKVNAFRAAGVTVVANLADIGTSVAALLEERNG
jgi:succinyl-CoA synthetase alpha subunit